MNAASSIARLEVTLDDVEPGVVRCLDVPLDIQLDRLHLTLQSAFGWMDGHLWEFHVRDVEWGIPDPDWPDGPRDARKATLSDVIDEIEAKTFQYLYDFGDGWEHTIRITNIEDADPKASYPALIEASGRCPPEDVGGPWGYEEFLEALGDPGHERHDELREWAPENFDPNDVPLRDLTSAIADLAKAWSRKPRKKSVT